MNRPQTQSPKLVPLLAVLGLLLAMWFDLAPKASAALLPQDHSDLFAANSSPAEHQETDALPPKNRVTKNRVWENFENPNEITPADQLNSLQLRWESDFGELELASGVLCYADGNPISKSDPFGLDALFLYGSNENLGDDSFFKRQAEAQAAQFTSNHTPIIGTVLTPGMPVPVYGNATETAHVFPATNHDEFNTALQSATDISNVTYNGHSWGLGDNIKLNSLDGSNLRADATIFLNGCNTGVDDNGSGTFSAQRFANHFGVKVRGVTEGLSYGLPYFGGLPGYMRGEGELTSPDFMWATPQKNSSK